MHYNFYADPNCVKEHQPTISLQLQLVRETIVHLWYELTFGSNNVLWLYSCCWLQKELLQRPCLWNGLKRPCYLFARKFYPEALDNLVNLFSNYTIFWVLTGSITHFWKYWCFKLFLHCWTSIHIYTNLVYNREGTGLHGDK